jgi:hypothetical protein
VASTTLRRRVARLDDFMRYENVAAGYVAAAHADVAV